MSTCCLWFSIWKLSRAKRWFGCTILWVSSEDRLRVILRSEEALRQHDEYKHKYRVDPKFWTKSKILHFQLKIYQKNQLILRMIFQVSFFLVEIKYLGSIIYGQPCKVSKQSVLWIFKFCCVKNMPSFFKGIFWLHAKCLLAWQRDI